jgi:biotin operon repressor
MLTHIEAQTVLLQQMRAAARDSREGWVNARKLAQNLNITTNAIHQAVSRLRKRGWRIITSDRETLGSLHYRLADDHPRPPDPSLTPATPGPRLLPRPTDDLDAPPFRNPRYRDILHP